MGENEGLATAGLVINIIAFLPAMLVALTCGLCNTMCTGAFLTPPDTTHQTVPWDRDGGPGSNPFEDLFDPPDAATAAPGVPPATIQPPPAPMERQGDETPLPPPPLPPGPAGAGAPAEPATAAPREPAPTEPASTPAPTDPASAPPATAAAPGTSEQAPASDPTPSRCRRTGR